MSAWEWLLISLIALIWLYFAGQSITLGVLKSVKCFFLSEAKRIQDNKENKHGEKKTEKYEK